MMEKLADIATRSRAEVYEGYKAVLLEMGWDGRDHRFRLDDAVGPWVNPVEYQLRTRR